MSIQHGEDPDAFWRRPPDHGPAGATGDPTRHPGPPDPFARSEESGYSGPPPSTPPPPDWRTPVYVEPPAPRRLPAQDPEALDAEEQSARTLTTGIAMVATAVIVVAVCLLCSRALF